MPDSSRSALWMALSYGALSTAGWVTGLLALPAIVDPANVPFWKWTGGMAWLLLTMLLIFISQKASRKVRLHAEEENERLRLGWAVFDGTHEGVLVCDASGRIVHVNRAFVEITGYQPEEVLGFNPSKFKSGRHGPEFYQQMYGSILSSGQWSGEIWNRRKSGEIYPQWQSIRGIKDDSGKLRHFVALFSDLTAIKRSEQELTQLAHYDALTQLPNRLLFTDRTAQALVTARSSKRGCALLLIDLDHFQNINDSLGHTLGDEVLKAVADRLRGLFDSESTLARLGGDEFGLLVRNCQQVVQAAALAQRMLDAFREPFLLEGHQLFITASIGISLFPHDAQDAGQLLRNADSALFKAKSNGREGYALYTQELTAHAQHRVELGSELRRAIEQQELRVFYQPIHDLTTRKIRGVEALVRWEHPQRGMVSPAEFIPIAEQNGLIADIDAWVLSTACRQMQQWLAAGEQVSFVAVNVSSRLFTHGDLDFKVAQALERSGLPPAFLELEITESAVMDDPEQAIEQMHRLRGLGVSLAIDDFGTGYSSLLRLKRMPVQKLKIDQGFVAGLPEGDDDISIVRAVIALAKSMNMRVLAEGIERADQAAFLLENGCQLGQGYWFARPVPADRIDWASAPDFISACS